MPTYIYLATNRQGKKEQGTLHAENRQSVIKKLQEEGCVILNLQEKESKKTEGEGKLRLSRLEKLMFVKNLAAMIGAGLTIIESISIMREQKPKRNMKKLLSTLETLIKGGQNVANSLDFFHGTFSPIFINMIKVGEEGGNLNEVLQYLEIQMEKDYELIKKVRSAMIYPIVILSVTFGLATFLIMFIIPKIMRIFSSFKVELPLSTRMLIGTNELLKNHGGKIALLVIALIFFLHWLKNRTFIKPYTHKCILITPILGKMTRLTNNARCTRILTSLLQSGVPLVKSLEIVSDTIQNVHFKKALQDTKRKVEKGESLGQSLTSYENLFPLIVSRMIQVGEKTGTLEKTTENLAIMFEKDVDNMAKTITTLIEPLLLLIMGVVVGGIAISMIAPIYQIPQLIQR